MLLFSKRPSFLKRTSCAAELVKLDLRLTQKVYLPRKQTRFNFSNVGARRTLRKAWSFVKIQQNVFFYKTTKLF